jgi:antibiotic biosynthesis monooxygenase (ABM) superfamily enzyme
VIERVWRGWIAREKAQAYSDFLQHAFLPAAHAIPGYLGARVLRRDVGDEVEFMTITHFDSLEAIRGFAGDELDRAHVAPEAQQLLSRWDERVSHFELAFDDAEPAEI